MATFFPRKESETVDTSVYQKPWNLGQVYQVEEKTKESFSSPYNSLVSNWNSNQEVMQLDLSEHNDSTDSVKSVSSSPVHIKLDETSHVPGPFEFQVTSRDHSRHKKEGSALGVTNMVTEDYKNSHREVERKRRMTISSKIEQLRGLLPSLQQTRKADVVSTLSATVDYMQSTLSENKRLKTQVAKLKEEMRELQEQLKESQSCQQDHSPETALLENKSNSDWFTSQQRLCHSDCHYRGPLKIDYSFPWTRYIPPNACDMRLASPEDLQRSCQILQLLSTVKNCYSFICDIHGHLVWLSNSVKDVLGYQPEDLLGSDVWSLLHPEDLDAVYPIVQTWHEIGFTSSVHLRRKRMDGSYVELNSCFTNLLTSNGEVEGCVCIETLLEGSSDRWLEAVYKMDIDGRFTYACPSVERMTGYRVDEIIGKPYTFNVHMDEQQLILNNLHRILFCFHREEEDMHMSGDRHLENLESVASRLRNKTNQTILTWFRRVSKDGNDIWLVSLTVASLDKQTGQPNGFVSIEHDITMHVQRWASVLSEMAMREYCSVDKVVSETGWRLYNVASDSLETQQELLKQWFGSTSLFAFQSVGCWKGNLIQQAPRLDWQYTLRLLVQKRRQQTLSYSQSIPLIFIELSSSEIDLKKQIAACGIREPVIRLGSLKDWLVLTDQLDLNNNWKTLGLNCLQRNHASWLFQSEQELFYGFHDSLESASHTIHSVAENGQQSLHQLILQAELPTKDKNELHNVDKVASSLRFNALDSWYTFRELEYQKRLAYAERGPQVLLQVPQTIFRFPRDALIHTDKQWIFVSDTFHHRIVVLETNGKILGTIGSGVAWFRDDNFSSCAFHEPSGMALDGDVIYIADTENSCLRMADLESGHVSTLYPNDYFTCHDNLTRALDFCDIWRTPWAAKVTSRDAKSPLSEDIRFGQPLSVAVRDKNIFVLTVSPLAVYKLSLVGEHPTWVQVLDKQIGKDAWLRYLEEFGNTVEKIPIETTQLYPLHNEILSYSDIYQLDYLPPPWTLHGIREQIADYDAFQYIYPFLRGRKIGVEDSLYLIPGIARVVIYITAPKGYRFAGKTLTHMNIQGPMVFTTPPVGIDDSKIPRGERSRRRLEGLDEPQDLFLPDPPAIDSFTGLPIVLDMYTFPGNGHITVDIVVYLTKEQVSTENSIFYDTIQLKAPVRVTSYGFETEYIYFTSKVESPLPNYETITIDRLHYSQNKVVPS